MFNSFRTGNREDRENFSPDEKASSGGGKLKFEERHSAQQWRVYLYTTNLHIYVYIIFYIYLYSYSI
jgi:hypothetical protein